MVLETDDPLPGEHHGAPPVIPTPRPPGARWSRGHVRSSPSIGDAARASGTVSRNPAIEQGRATLPDGTPTGILALARTEGRSAAHLGKDGWPTFELQATQADRLDDWRLPQHTVGER